MLHITTCCVRFIVEKTSIQLRQTTAHARTRMDMFSNCWHGWYVHGGSEWLPTCSAVWGTHMAIADPQCMSVMFSFCWNTPNSCYTIMPLLTTQRPHGLRSNIRPHCNSHQTRWHPGRRWGCGMVQNLAVAKKMQSTNSFLFDWAFLKSLTTTQEDRTGAGTHRRPWVDWKRGQNPCAVHRQHSRLETLVAHLKFKQHFMSYEINIINHVPSKVWGLSCPSWILNWTATPCPDLIKVVTQAWGCPG